MTDKSEVEKLDLKIIYCTEFKNQFDQWQLLHASSSKNIALDDTRTSGRIVECVTLDEYEALEQKHKEWREAVGPLLEEINKSLDENNCSDDCSANSYQKIRACDCYQKTLKEALSDFEAKVGK